MVELEQLAKQAQAAIIAAAEDLTVLEDLRVEYLGKKGRLTGLLKGSRQLSLRRSDQQRAQRSTKLSKVFRGRLTIKSKSSKALP